MKTVAIDTNIILRYLLADDQNLYQKAKDIFIKAERGDFSLLLDEVILAETIWTLTRPHDQPRKEIYQKLNALFSQDWIINPRKELLLEALETYNQTNLSYIDCWLHTVAKNLNIKLETFDKKLEKFTRAS